MREMKVEMRSDMCDGIESSEDGEQGLDVRGIDLYKRYADPMRTARDIEDFCKRAKAKSQKVV